MSNRENDLRCASLSCGFRRDMQFESGATEPTFGTLRGPIVQSSEPLIFIAGNDDHASANELSIPGVKLT
jgi:hypothetical protein